MHNVIKLAVAALILSSCSSHPQIMPGKLSRGESSYAYSFSAENMVPVYTMNYGISGRLDGSVSVGLPLWGSGAALTYLSGTDTTAVKVYNSKTIIGWSWQHNPQYELTFIKERISPLKQRAFFYGMRTNYIPNGIAGDTAWRFGFVTGLLLREHWMFEFGYTYDFELETDWLDPSTGWPTEHHPLTGISLKFSFGDFTSGLRGQGGEGL